MARTRGKSQYRIDPFQVPSVTKDASMIITTTRKPIVASAALYILSSIGCMTSPGNDEYIGKTVDSVYFAGYSDIGGEKILIQARNNHGYWQTIATAQSGSYAYPYDGRSWYPWSTSAYVPSRCWRKNIPFISVYSADVRAVSADGTHLYAFEQGFWGYFDPEVPVNEMYAEHGHGTEVTIWAVTST